MWLVNTFLFSRVSAVAVLDLVPLICLEKHRADLQIVIPLSVISFSHGPGVDSDNLGMSQLDG